MALHLITYLRKRWRWILLVLVIGLLGAGCRSGDQGDAVSELTYGLTDTPAGIDPHIHADSVVAVPLRSVYDTLVYRDSQTLEFVPGLAESWTISPDGLTYVFTLRQDVTFHDGTPFNADAVRVNIQRILSPDASSQKSASLLGPVGQVEVVDEYTARLTLTEPYAPLLDGLSQPYLGIASPAALAEYDTLIYQFHQVGTGPYRFIEYMVNDHITLERNEAYAWAPSVSLFDFPSVDRITFTFLPVPASRDAALRSDEVDIVGRILPSDARQLVADGRAQLNVSTIPGAPQQLMFNTNRIPTSSREVREALILASDRQAIVQTVFQGYAPVAYGPISADTLFYDPIVQTYYPYDPVAAIQLFDDTGWIDSNDDGWRDDNGSQLELVLVIPPWGLAPEVASLLKDQWEATLQVHVRIQQVASASRLTQAADIGEYSAIAVDTFGLDPAFLYSFYHSTGSLNWSRYGDEELDSWLNAAQREQNESVRAQLYSQVQQRIMDQALILPIRDYTNLNGVQFGIEGLSFDATGLNPYLIDLTTPQTADQQ